MLNKLTRKSESSRVQPTKSGAEPRCFRADQNVVDVKEKHPRIHLQRAVELYHPIATQQSSGFPGSLKALVQRVQIMRGKRPDHSEVLDKMEHIFGQLHNDFDEREHLLNKKLEAIEKMQVRETRMLKWFSIPLTVVAMIGLGYLFFIAYSMQNSVAYMSVNMGTMSSDISSMTTDTKNMSSNMSHMTDSMHNMNNNMAYMTRDVWNMSNNMGAMSRSVAPMGQAAESASPMIGMMRSFMPF